MKCFLVVMILLAVVIGVLPEAQRQPETGTIADAFDTWLSNKKAYGRAPCLRTSGTPCPDTTARERCYLP